MALSDKVKTILFRAVRSAAAVAVAGIIGWLAGPDFAELVGTEYAVLVAAVLTPLLLALDKWIRYGSDPGEA